MDGRQPPLRSEERERLDAIRCFFLQPFETYSIEELSKLWRVHEDDVRAVFHDELSQATDRVAWAVALEASVNFCMLRPLDVECALGADFTRVRPETWRTASVVIHVPAFVKEALAREPSVPSHLPLDARIEQLLIELFTPHHMGTIDAPAQRRRSR
ncbi:MAG TPA: hypothetical protein VGQ76_00395 [Thermoanaerobaculia bacterium]|jgi:hypothetical protein|nr:hypothetical protein [Thermoanaerobaculia bacterium]